MIFKPLQHSSIQELNLSKSHRNPTKIIRENYRNGIGFKTIKNTMDKNHALHKTYVQQ
jgi:hypothetical protein